MAYLVAFSEIEAPDEKKFDADRAQRPMTWDTDLVIYANWQWAVTDYGIENVAGLYHYYISKNDLGMPMGDGARLWPDHMAEKNWVDVEAFRDVYRRALEIFAEAVVA